MAFDSFLKIKDIPGDAVAKGHKDEIEVLSYSWGITNATDPTGGGGGGGVGKVVLSDFHFVKKVDKASPLLFTSVCSGERFPDVLFTVEEGASGKNKAQSFLKLKLSEVFISSFQASGSSDSPTESVSLSFVKIEIDVAGGPSAASCARPGVV
jgi:type VI secretion system secreted protein Hcp